MVLDPKELQAIALQAVRGAATDGPSGAPRRGQAQISFSAMLYAIQAGCNCEACQLLREAVDTMRVRPKQETPAHGPDLASET